MPAAPDSFQTAFRPQYPKYGRRYSLLIDGVLYAPVEFDSRPENPNNLNRDARIVAARVAEALGVTVEVVKHLRNEDRVEGFYVSR